MGRTEQKIHEFLSLPIEEKGNDRPFEGDTVCYIGG
jgi:hypothetical protein